MKRIFCALFALLIVLTAVLGCSAAEVSLADDGKTVVTYGDWVLEKIHNDEWWNMDSYIGSDEEVEVPYFIDHNMVVSLGTHCFANNTTVKRVITSSPLWTVSDYAFLDCTALESFVCNYALNTIGVSAFSGTTSLKEINLQDSVVTEIADHAFTNSGLSSVELPETCTKIGDYAFSYCGSLNKIVIPDSVTEIADTVFDYCGKVVIYANSESYAITYAQEHDIPYVMIDQPYYIVGDADDDGSITIFDVTEIQRLLAKYDVEDPEMVELRGDVEFDGLSIFDATLIQRYIAHFDIPDTVHIGEYVNITES